MIFALCGSLLGAAAVQASQPAEVVQAAPPETPRFSNPDLLDDLVAYYKMDENTTNQARVDSSGLSHNLSPSSNCYYCYSTTNGKIIYAASYTGSSDQYHRSYHEHTDASYFELLSSFTITGWINPSGTGTYNLVGKRDNFYIQIGSGQIRFYVHYQGGSTSSVTLTYALTPGAYYFFAARFDAYLNVLKVRINATDATPAAYLTGGIRQDTIHYFQVGALGYPGPPNTIWAPYYGLMDEVGVWSRALTDNELAALYNAGTGCAYSWSSCPVDTSMTRDRLYDGGMEQQPFSTYWFTTTDSHSGFYGGFGNPVNGRVQNSGLFGITTFLKYRATAACYVGFQISGRNDPYSGPGEVKAPMKQHFYWSGGDFYWKARVAGVDDTTGKYNAYIYITLTDTGAETVLFDGAAQEGTEVWGWALVYNHIHSLPAGIYDFVLSNVGEHEHGSLYDDVAIGSSALPSTCSENTDPAASPTPGGPTVTVTRTPPPGLDLRSCSFELDNAAWRLEYGAYIARSGGPVGPQYGVAPGRRGNVIEQTSYAGMIKQDFYISQNNGSQPLYIRGWGRGNLFIKIFAYAGFHPLWEVRVTYNAWSQFTAPFVAVPPGYYQLILSADEPNALTGPYNAVANYDGITLGWDTTSALCDGGNVPTAGPTAFVTSTVTPTGATPTFTATPEYYAFPTPIGAGTRTPWYTPGPITATPNGTDVPDQPPGGYNAPCIRPSGLNMVSVPAWLDYEACEARAWVSFGPQQVRTLDSVSSKFSGKEPIGTMLEVSDTITELNESVQSYDWSGESMRRGPVGAKAADPGGVGGSVDPGSDDTPPDVTRFLPMGNPSNPFNSGYILPTMWPGSATSGSRYVMECQTSLENIGGTVLKPGICWTYDFMKKNGLMGLFNGVMNMIAGIVLVIYAKNKLQAKF